MGRFSLPVTLPFNWEHLLAFLRLRATPGIEEVTALHYARTYFDESQPQSLIVTYAKSEASLHITYSGSPVSRKLAQMRVQHIFKGKIDTVPIENFLGRDSWLTNGVREHPGLRVPGGWSAFEIAVRAVLGQQVSVPAATTLMGRLVRLAGTRLNEKDWLFPTPLQVVSSTLNGIGVPGARLETVKSLARFFAENGEDCLGQPDVKERLLTVKGIGKWTAGYILMRSTDSPDYWPEGDLVLRKALSKTKPMISHEDMEKIFRSWSPYRSYATIHLWRNHSNQIQPPGGKS